MKRYEIVVARGQGHAVARVEQRGDGSYYKVKDVDALLDQVDCHAIHASDKVVSAEILDLKSDINELHKYVERLHAELGYEL